MKNLIVKHPFGEYNCYYGDNSIRLLSTLLPNNVKCMIITENNIPEDIVNEVARNAKNYQIVTLESGENAKSLESVIKITNELLAAKYNKKDYIIAVGGGVITDICGYVASIYKRGMNLINVPTSTLAMIDASIGGKNAININNIKNVLGTVYFPRSVIMDFNYLDSLDRRNYNSGIVEALKVGLLFNKHLVEMIKEKYDIREIIIEAIKLKQRIVEIDPYDKGKRLLLNFGHTIAHALELNDKYDLLHGEAVATGIYYMIDNDELKQEYLQIIKNLNIEIIDDINFYELRSFILNDKKKEAKTIKIIEITDIEEYVISSMEIREIEEKICRHKWEAFLS